MSTLQASLVMFAVLLASSAAVTWYLARSESFERTRGAGWALMLRLGAAISGVVGTGWAYLVVVFAGAAAAPAILWPLGVLAFRVQPIIDEPGYRWLTQWNEPESVWHALNEFVTKIGDPVQCVVMVVAASLLLAAAWRTRWWIPPLALTTALALEWHAQQVIGKVVARGVPPYGNGTWPSGGTARVLLIYGLIALLVMIRWPQIGRRWRIGLWSAVGLLTASEAYSRLYLLKHWPTDLPAGLLFGVILLLTMIAGVATLIGPEA
ncbi:MAG: hypothetical protein ABI622_04885, partial [Chloroflexota bacterium]